MKAWIKVEDSEEHRRIVQATDMARALYYIDSMFWGYLRDYENDRMSTVKYNQVKELWDRFTEIKEECGINLDELYK